MQRVVFDTNVWVSALLFPASVPAQAIDFGRSRRIHSVTSDALIQQARRALSRLGFPPAAVDQAELEMRDVSLVVTPTIRLSVITEKESDNRVLECAVTGQVDVIVTGDRKHLLRLGQYRGIPIISPRDFVQSSP